MAACIRSRGQAQSFYSMKSVPHLDMDVGVNITEVITMIKAISDILQLACCMRKETAHEGNVLVNARYFQPIENEKPFAHVDLCSATNSLYLLVSV